MRSHEKSLDIHRSEYVNHFCKSINLLAACDASRFFFAFFDHQIILIKKNPYLKHIKFIKTSSLDFRLFANSMYYTTMVL